MMSIARFGAVVAILALSAPGVAFAEPAGCEPALTSASFGTGEEADVARLQCDIKKSIEISRLSEQVHGPRKDAAISIVDTASPSGAAYVYDVYPVSGEMVLEARSVPISGSASRAPACRMTTVLPPTVAQKLDAVAASGALLALPGYGSREEATLNPDGSRTVRLLLESHDIVTTISTPDGAMHFSRHAKGSDEIADLNASVIGVANFSSGWSCNRS